MHRLFFLWVVTISQWVIIEISWCFSCQLVLTYNPKSINISGVYGKASGYDAYMEHRWAVVSGHSCVNCQHEDMMHREWQSDKHFRWRLFSSITKPCRNSKATKAGNTHLMSLEDIPPPVCGRKNSIELVSVFSLSTNNRLVKIAHFNSEMVLWTTWHTVIYPDSGSLLDVIVLCLTKWYWR
jgi:hypothetical protein